MDRRRFRQWVVVATAARLPRGAFQAAPRTATATGAPGIGDAPAASPALPSYSPARIPNEYALLLPGEADALARAPTVSGFADGSVLATPAAARGAPRRLAVGEEVDGWRLVALFGDLNGAPTAVLEKHVSHRGAIVYLTELGEIARIPKGIGDLANIRPRPVAAPADARFERPATFPAQPDRPGDYILGSDEDPSYENVAALGPELTGWTLVANEESGPERSLWLEADGRSREFGGNPQSLFAPDLTGRLFDPRRFLPSEYLYEYVPGYSKRTLLGGYLPAADIGVWNPRFKVGYEVIVLLPPGADARPIGRVRALLPEAKEDLIPAGDTNAGQALPVSRWIDR